MPSYVNRTTDLKKHSTSKGKPRNRNNYMCATEMSPATWQCSQ